MTIGHGLTRRVTVAAPVVPETSILRRTFRDRTFPRLHVIEVVDDALAASVRVASSRIWSTM